MFEEEKGTEARDSRNVSRRNFFKGAAALVGTAAVSGMAGCSASNSGTALSDTGSSESGEIDAITQRLLDRGIAGANLPDARPIAPAPVPDAWDEETDVVVVGMGGGGLVATALLASKGLKVIGLEKEGSVGGAGRHSAGVVCELGHTRDQDACGFPGLYETEDLAIQIAEMNGKYSIDESLLRALLADYGEGFDWIFEQDGLKEHYVCTGFAWWDEYTADETYNHVLGNDRLINYLEEDAKNYGADIRVLSPVSQFVYDGNRVQGVMLADGSSIHATKGVVLMAGGMGMNKDLVKAYLPSCYEGAVQGGPMPCHTGEIFRMGLGLGADFSGYDSWCCWEGAIDESIAGGDGEWWHYFFHGERQLFHNPWCIIDKYGNRVPYFAYNVAPYIDLGAPNVYGDVATTACQMARVGHHAYSICDSKFPEDIYKKDTTVAGGDTCRLPIDDPATTRENSYVTTNWLDEVNEAVERGAIKKADTLEELAEMLKLDADVVVKAVENYNRLCDQGYDDELAFPYDPSWLQRVDMPPFYAAIVGGQIGKTMCGLRVNDKFQVVNEDAKPLGGLYAGFSTMGGLNGEGDYGSFSNGATWFSGIGASLITGYIAAKKLIENE